MDNTNMTFFDTETCGLHGPIVLLQWAEDDGPINLHEVWQETVQDTLVLIERFCQQEVCGFNLAFDWFHLCQFYTTLLHLDPNEPPNPEEYRKYEKLARSGPCLKPKAACDLMLHARKGPYQSTMDRSDIRIRRVPTALAFLLAAELERRIKLKDIYFARRKQKNLPKWQVMDIDDNVDFKNIVLKFKASSALKALAMDALGLQEVLLFSQIEVDRKWWPFELGYAPFNDAAYEEIRRAKLQKDAKVLSKKKQGPWPEVIEHHIQHWAYNGPARKYATKDVDYTRRLYIHFGSPAAGDNDSELACMVGACRWKGYAVDLEKIKVLREQALLRRSRTPIAPAKAREYIEAVMDDTDKLGMGGSTKKVVLEEVGQMLKECPECSGATCQRCGGSQVIQHPAAARALEVLEARKSDKERELYDKLLIAGRFHASFVVIGTLSSRMAGNNKLNAQGIKKSKKVREAFLLADPDRVLCGGDFVSFEVVLAEANYNDEGLRKELLSGKKIHGIFGTMLFPPNTYEQIMASNGTARDLYTLSKSGVFAKIYAGEAYTLHKKLGVPIEIAEEVSRLFEARYPGVRIARMRVFNKFCSMRQPGGIGSRVEWHEPDDYIESMLGFPRYFTLENQICKALFDLANRPPPQWRETKIRVVRRDREQTIGGAVQSALYAAAFAMQAANMRAAANHEIQSTGATITKDVQRGIWDLQPYGVHEWKVQPMNIHDEIMCPAKPDMVSQVREVVTRKVDSYKPKIPLIEIDWSDKLGSWADK
jgi:hypothetical protein